jgi:AcrR family transcriptional regulator
MEQNKRLTSSARKEQIIQSALGVFIEKGYAGTTTSEIAKTAGISEVTLFRHFSSKQEIFLAGIEPILFDSLSSDIPTIQGTISKEQLSSILYNRIKFLSDHAGIVKLILNEHLANISESNLVERMAETFGKLLSQYKLDEVFVTRLFMGSFLSFLYLPTQDEITIHNFVNELSQLILERK